MNLVAVVVVELAAERDVVVDVDVWQLAVPVTVVVLGDLLVWILGAVEDLELLDVAVIVTVVVVVVIADLRLEFGRLVDDVAVFDELEDDIGKAVFLAVDVDVVAVEVELDDLVRTVDDRGLEFDAVAEFDLVAVVVLGVRAEREVIVVGTTSGSSCQWSPWT